MGSTGGGAEVVAMVSCDDGFVSPAGPVHCFVGTGSSGDVGVVREGELMCLRRQDSDGCGKSCYVPVVVVGVVLLLLLLLVVLLLIIYCNRHNVSHGYAITGKEGSMSTLHSGASNESYIYC